MDALQRGLRRRGGEGEPQGRGEHKENYLNYYEALLPRLKTGGLLVADNVLWSGKVLAPRKKTDKAIAAFNEKLRRDSRVEVVMLPVRDGVSLIRKR